MKLINLSELYAPALIAAFIKEYDRQLKQGNDVKEFIIILDLKENNTTVFYEDMQEYEMLSFMLENSPQFKSDDLKYVTKNQTIVNETYMTDTILYVKSNILNSIKL